MDAYEGLTREAIEERAKRLEEAGMVDLDAPLRDAIPAIARNMTTYRGKASGWWIIASGDNPHAVCECEF